MAKLHTLSDEQLMSAIREKQQELENMRQILVEGKGTADPVEMRAKMSFLNHLKMEARKRRLTLKE